MSEDKDRAEWLEEHAAEMESDMRSPRYHTMTPEPALDPKSSRAYILELERERDQLREDLEFAKVRWSRSMDDTEALLGLVDRYRAALEGIAGSEPMGDEEAHEHRDRLQRWAAAALDPTEARCGDAITHRGDNHEMSVCEKPAGHIDAHSSPDCVWTDGEHYDRVDPTEAPDTEAHVRDGRIEYRPLGSDRGTTP